MADPIYEGMLNHIEKSVNEEKVDEELSSLSDDEFKAKYEELLDIADSPLSDVQPEELDDFREEAERRNIDMGFRESCESKVDEGLPFPEEDVQDEPEEEIGEEGPACSIEGLVNQRYKKEFSRVVQSIVQELLSEGFEFDEIIEWLNDQVSSILALSSREVESKVNEEDIAERKLSDYSEKELQGLMSKLSQIQKVFPDVSSKMDKVQDELTRRDQAKRESKE